MSSSKNRKIRNIAIGGLAAAALGLTLHGAGSTGADFSASHTGNVSVQAGTLTVQLSDADNTGTFKLSYPNIKPGDMPYDQFTVKNTGSIPANVKLGMPISVTGYNLGGGQGNANPAQLSASIDGYLAPTSVTSLTGDIQLGSLQPGESRTYTVRVGLDHNAGNEWQGKSVSADVTVTLNQQ